MTSSSQDPILIRMGRLIELRQLMGNKDYKDGASYIIVQSIPGLQELCILGIGVLVLQSLG